MQDRQPGQLPKVPRWARSQPAASRPPGWARPHGALGPNVAGVGVTGVRRQQQGVWGWFSRPGPGTGQAGLELGTPARGRSAVAPSPREWARQ